MVSRELRQPVPKQRQEAEWLLAGLMSEDRVKQGHLDPEWTATITGDRFDWTPWVGRLSELGIRFVESEGAH